MKKVLALILALVLTLSLCACDKGGGKGKEFSLGTIDGDIYKNEFIGISYELNDGWRFYTEEEMMEINQYTEEMAGEEYREVMKDAEMIYDMFAADATGVNNINVNMQKTDQATLDALDISDNFAESAPTVQASLENMGYTDYEYQLGVANVDGKTVEAFFSSAKYLGETMYQVAFQVKCNGYLATVAVTTFYDDARQDVLNHIKWID